MILSAWNPTGQKLGRSDSYTRMFHFSIAFERAVISKEEFSQHGYIYHCVGFASSQVDNSSICPVPELNAIVILLRYSGSTATNPMQKSIRA